MPGELPKEILQLLASGPAIGSPTAEDVADVLWLAQHTIGRTQSPPEADTAAGQFDDGVPGRGTEEDSAPAIDVQTRAADSGPSGREEAEGEQRRSGDGLRSGGAAGKGPLVELYPAGAPSWLGPSGSATDGDFTGTRASAVRVPGAFALADGLALSRALRPLKREVRAPGPLVLDEAASATASAEACFPFPVQLPATEPWLSVDLVVDAGPSMVMWHSFSAELRTLLERHGAFRDVRCWSMLASDTGIDLEPFRRRGWRPGRRRGLRRSPEQLTDPTGRRAVLVLTDGVGSAWQRGGIGLALGQWARTSPVAILQVLPRRLWHRTSLRPVPVRATAQSRTGRSLPLIHATDSIAPPLTKGPLDGWIPVLEVDAGWLKPWADVVGGKSTGGTPMLAVPAAGLATGPSDQEPQSERLAPTGPWADLDLFRAEASPAAFELAGYLAAAPLTLPVMRLVQRAMLPASGPMHLAEVFLSGLLVAVDGPHTESQDPETVLYDFAPGVRDQLLDTLTRRESMQVLDVLSGISGAVAERFGGTLDFRALVPSGAADSRFSIPESGVPFATVALSVLQGLGGPNRQLAALMSTAVAPRKGAAGPPSAPSAGEDAQPVADGPKLADGPRSPYPGRAEPLPSLSVPSISKIYDPMLFVGLGGTGALIGAELERGLRRSLCGPDGTALAGGGRRAPFQLPDCLQFVYADFSERELDQLPQFNAEGAEAAAYAHTSRVIHDLPPNYDTSTEVTRLLRVALHEETREWLPPAKQEPKVTPLHMGAGQLPTIGRAALFATLRNGLEPVLGQLRAAIAAVSNSVGDLRDLGGRQIRGCDVFVAFSVAGGTGAGIYYDFIHLIGHEFRKFNMPGVKIYPLVVMPSAFPPEAGGGREAELNAGRALVDLSRLVDDQNAPSPDFGDVEQPGALSVRYPQEGVVRLRPSTVQTAILLGRPAGIRPEDLRRSATAMVMSLIGTHPSEENTSGRAEGDYPSSAAGFVSQSVQRSAPSRSGIGRRGMSTALAASLTVPADNLAEIMAGRLLANAVRDMAEQARRADEGGTARVREMFMHSGLGPLWTREVPEVLFPDPLPKGSKAIGQALRDRIGDMEDGLHRLSRELDRAIPRLVEDFRPRVGARNLIGLLGPFRMQHVMAGLVGHPQRPAERGFVGMLDNRKNEPERPKGVEHSTPQVPRIKGGLVPARWGDPDVQQVIEEQDAWYRWRASMLWHRGWKDHEARWRVPLVHAMKEVSELDRALRAYEEDEHKSFTECCRELYRDDRAGLSCLLPPQNNLEALYYAVFDRLCQLEGLAQDEDPAALLDKMIHPDEWQRALDAVRHSPRAAVKEIKQVVERRVKGLFGEASMLNDHPLLPSLGMLLQAAAGDEDATDSVDSHWLDQFRSQLAGLLPVGFTPAGNGPLKVLVIHPHTEGNSNAVQFLRQELNLPREPGAVMEFRAAATDSITVVLFRSGMSLTDVPEVRHILRMWSQSHDAAGTDDFLHWRQRLGYRDDWLASTEGDRQRILHSILCAMWNGRVAVEGPAASPHSIRIRLQDGDSAAMTLRLEAFDESVSSWPGLLRAYEQWVLLDEGEIIQDFCDQLMAAQPTGLATTPEPPAPLFRILVHEVAPQQIALLEEISVQDSAGDKEWIVPLLGFWERTLNGALDLRFPSAQRRTRPTLRALDQRYAPDGGTGPAAGRRAGGPINRASWREPEQEDTPWWSDASERPLPPE